MRKAMKQNTENIYFLKRKEALDGVAVTGVSLHCHSLHSREWLDFVPHYAERIPIVRQIWRREMRRLESENGTRPDFSAGFWQPPLTGEDVFASEAASLGSVGLRPIISITDHDRIDANLELNRSSHDVPISMEWTVPFENAFFHLGIHNLPKDSAKTLTDDLLEYTYCKGEPDNERLTELFEMLNAIPDLLIVLNHPIWDIEMIGQEDHEIALRGFLRHHREWLHAIEVNGFREWSENETAIELAMCLGLPIISGGDRHCCQPNTMFNVTNASDFSEFANEIRGDRHSRVVITPGYHISLPSRQLASIAQILGDYSHFPDGRRLWSDRIFLDAQDGMGLRSLTDQWEGKRPLWSHVALGVLRIMGHSWFRPVVNAAVGDKDIGRQERATTQSSLGSATPGLTANLLDPESI